MHAINLHFSEDKLAKTKSDMYSFSNLLVTRKCPLRIYILGALIYTTACEQLWGGDETLVLK